MNYNIALCEDSDSDRLITRTYIQRVFEEMCKEYTLEEFWSGDGFLAQLRPYHFHIAVFDIEMKKVNGIEAARKLREVDKNVIIGFTTSYPGHVFSSFDAEPLQYLIKPVKENEFRNFMKKAVGKVDERNEVCFSLTYNNSIYRIPVSNILYFASNGRVVEAVTTQGRYQFYAKLSSVEDGVPSFIRCHQSFLINPEFVANINGDNIYLMNGDSVTISKSRKKDVRDSYIFYVGSVKL